MGLTHITAKIANWAADTTSSLRPNSSSTPVPSIEDRQLADDGLSEDDIADLTNDRHCLDAIKKDFETYRDQVIRNAKMLGLMFKLASKGAASRHGCFTYIGSPA